MRPDAADAARRGGGAVAEVVTTMDGIAQSSRKIAEIIGVNPLRAKLSAFAVSSFFIGIAGAVTGAVFLVMGIQGSGDQQPDTFEQGNFGTQDPGADYDWDGNFRREFGDGQHR